MEQQVAYISTSEVARVFGVDRSTVSRWVTSGTLRPAITTPGGHHKFTRDAVNALVAASAHDTEVTPRAQSA